MTIEGHKVIDTVGSEHLSFTTTFLDFDFRHLLERSYPIFSILNELHYIHVEKNYTVRLKYDDTHSDQEFSECELESLTVWAFHSVSTH